MKKTLALLFCGTLATLPFGAAAESKVEVGRVKVVLAEDGWQATDVEADDIGVDKGISGVIRGKAKVLTLAGPDGKAIAAIHVYATWGSNLSLRIESHCEAGGGFYVNDFTKGRNAAPECLKMVRPMPSEALMKGRLARLGKANEVQKLNVPEMAYVLLGDFAMGNGAVIEFEGLLAPDFNGLPGGKPTGSPGSVPDEVAAWGDALGEAARKALRSMSGELRMPPVSAGAASATPK